MRGILCSRFMQICVYLAFKEAHPLSRIIYYIFHYMLGYQLNNILNHTFSLEHFDCYQRILSFVSGEMCERDTCSQRQLIGLCDIVDRLHTDENLMFMTVRSEA